MDSQFVLTVIGTTNILETTLAISFPVDIGTDGDVCLQLNNVKL